MASSLASTVISSICARSLRWRLSRKEQTDNDPDRENEVDTAADADDFCKAGRVRRNPDEIEPADRSEHGDEPDCRRTPVLGQSIEQNAKQKCGEDELRNHRWSLRANRSTRIISVSPSV